MAEKPWFVYSKVEDEIFCLPCASKDFSHFVCNEFRHGLGKQKKS